jgi:hypothetical protein
VVQEADFYIYLLQLGSQGQVSQPEGQLLLSAQHWTTCTLGTPREEPHTGLIISLFANTFPNSWDPFSIIVKGNSIPNHYS